MAVVWVWWCCWVDYVAVGQEKKVTCAGCDGVMVVLLGRLRCCWTGEEGHLCWLWWCGYGAVAGEEVAGGGVHHHHLHPVPLLVRG